jgi:NADP-dependent 3-hydroxy acid dehydrogenase YdfG
MTSTITMAGNRSPSLAGKSAVVFGAGSSIGSAVAKEFAAEGAQVFLVGRTKPNLEEVAKQIATSGGAAQTAVLDGHAR